MKRKFRFLFILIPIVFITAATFVTMGLWNWLMPALFGLGAITFLKAAGILLLAKILFGGRGGNRFSSYRHHHHGRMAFAGCIPNKHFSGHETWKTKMQERWQNLSPEQKEKFAGRCGKWFNAEKAKENSASGENQVS